MKTRVVLLSLITSALINVGPSFSRLYGTFKNRHVDLSRSTGRGLEFYPVKFNKGKEREGISFENKSLKLLTESPLSVDRFAVDTAKQGSVALQLKISEREEKELLKMTKKYSGSMLGIFYEGRPMALVKMNGKKSDQGVKFVVEDVAKFERVVNNFSDIV